MISLQLITGHVSVTNAHGKRLWLKQAARLTTLFHLQKRQAAQNYTSPRRLGLQERKKKN